MWLWVKSWCLLCYYVLAMFFIFSKCTLSNMHVQPVASLLQKCKGHFPCYLGTYNFLHKKKKKITWTCWWWDERSSLLPANPTKQSTDTWGLARSCLWKQWTYHFCDKWQCYAFKSFFCTCVKINWIDHLTHLKKRYATLILHEVCTYMLQW